MHSPVRQASSPSFLYVNDLTIFVQVKTRRQGEFRDHRSLDGRSLWSALPEYFPHKNVAAYSLLLYARRLRLRIFLLNFSISGLQLGSSLSLWGTGRLLCLHEKACPADTAAVAGWGEQVAKMHSGGPRFWVSVRYRTWSLDGTVRRRRRARSSSSWAVLQMSLILGPPLIKLKYEITPLI